MSILHKMNNKEVSNVVTPKDLNMLRKKTGSIYKTINIVANRADQLNSQLKSEIMSKVEEFASHGDSFDEVQENKEQIELSKVFEKLPKPTLMSLKEFEDDKLYHREIE